MLKCLLMLVPWVRTFKKASSKHFSMTASCLEQAFVLFPAIALAAGAGAGEQSPRQNLGTPFSLQQSLGFCIFTSGTTASIKLRIKNYQCQRFHCYPITRKYLFY